MYESLPLGSIKASGWLKQQLQIQANGLSGNLGSFLPYSLADITQTKSGLILHSVDGLEDLLKDGNVDRYLFFEFIILNVQYWLDGVTALAFTLDDQYITDKVNFWMDYIIANQQPTGMLGPEFPRQMIEFRFFVIS